MSQNLFQFAFIALLAFSSSAQAAEIKEIRIATEASYPPFEYLTATGDIQGFEQIGLNLSKSMLISST